MIRLPDRAHRLVCVVSFCLLVAPALAHAQEDDAFKQGLEARGDRRWPDVVKFMRSAINADPKESTRKVRTGGLLGAFGGGTEYMPHYLLGEACYKSGDVEGADFHFSELSKFYPQFRNLKNLLYALDLRSMVNLKL